VNHDDQARMDVLEALCDAFNRHDLDGIMSHFTEDASLDMPRGAMPWGTRFEGKADVRRGLALRFVTTPDVHYAHARHWVCGDLGVSEWLLTGTTLEGIPLEVRGCDHYTFRGGQVMRKDSYWKIVG
jgi:ketosteroid isomerase-like protein